jgi:tetratricopeptide (TPR) repeat protein
MRVLAIFYRNAPGIIGGDAQRAETYQREMLRLDPVSRDFFLAEGALSQHQWDKAEGFYRAALEANSQSFATNARLAIFYLSENGGSRFVLAEKYARDATAVDPGRAGGYSHLIQALIYQNGTASPMRS